jgi:uncharacterized surface protein with fasciclin (FAS1) repeats
MKKSRLATLACLPVLALGVAACGGDDENESSSSSSGGTMQEQQAQQMPANEDIVALAQGNDQLSTLVTAVSTADLAGTLQGKGPYTVFAPTNAAFGDLGQNTVDTLLERRNRDQLTSVLTYHVVPGKLEAAQLRNGQTLTTVEGSKLRVRIDGSTVSVGGATVVTPDVEASNGVVHVIDGVLQPPVA